MFVLLNILRLLKIAFVFYKRGGLFLLYDRGIIPRTLICFLSIPILHNRSLSKGRILKLILQDLGSFFIKFGQTLATRSDLIGDAAAQELAELQDRLPSKDNPHIIKYIEKELNCRLVDLFENFNTQPIATASIAHVFKTKLSTGQEVALKVLKPGIEKEFKKDIKLFFWLAKITEKICPSLKRLKLIEIVETFADTTKSEMDLRLEAAAASELSENHRNDKKIYIPKVYWHLTTKRILVTEWIDGIPIYKTKLLKQAKYDLKEILYNFTSMFLNQAYRDGFFHADLHAGNILIMKNSNIALIDFGIMGRLDKKTRFYLAQILKGFLDRNYNYVAKIHFKAGYVPRHKSIGNFAQACRAIGEPIVGLPSNKISVGKLLSHLFKVTKDFDMPTQPQLLLIQKTTVVVEGIGTILDPSANLWKIAEPWIKTWSAKHLKFDAKIVDNLTELANFLNNDFKNFLKNKYQSQAPESVKTT